MYLSGILGIDVKTKKLVSGGTVAETRQALLNMGHILKEAGSNYNKGYIYLEIHFSIFFLSYEIIKKAIYV